MTPDECRQHLQVVGPVVQGRDVAEILTPGRQKAVPVRHGDLFQGLEAVGRKPRTDDLDLPHAFPAPGRQGLVRVGAQPFLAADPGLEGDPPSLGGEPEGRGRQTHGLTALATVGVAAEEVVPGDTVKGEEQPVRLALLGPMGADALRQGGDVARLVVVLVDEAQLRQAAPSRELGGNRIEAGGRGGRRVLRVERQHQDPAGVQVTETGQCRSERGVAVAHPECHPYLPRQKQVEPLLQGRGLAPGDGQQGRALGRPHRMVGAGGLPRAQAQQDTVQDRPPEGAVKLDHPRIAQELGQIAPNRRYRRGVRRAQVIRSTPTASGAPLSKSGLLFGFQG